MKIGFIVSSFPSLSQTFILNQITGLLDLGHDVEIFARNNPNEPKKHPDIYKYHLNQRTHYMPHIPHSILKRRLKAIYLIITNFHKSPFNILKLLNIPKYGKDTLSLIYTLIPFLDKSFDILHCHFGPNGIISLYLKEMGISGKYITTFHGYDISGYPRIMGENIYNNLFRKVDLITWNANLTKRCVIELGCDEDKIIILPYGIRIEKFRFSERKVQDKEPIRILTVGRLVEKKGHEYAIKAIAEVVKRHGNIEYMIAGDGPSRSKLENLVVTLEIENYVKFLGAVDQDEVLKLYERSHIFLLSSVTASDGDSEGLPVVLLEAQAVGLPIISSLHGGIPEGVLDSKSGFLVPEKDVDALADKIEYLIKNPELWSEMGRYGRKFVEERYDIQKLNQRLVKIYKALLTNDTSTLEELRGEQ
ncbi:MAG: glycosyl transferase group 1 [Candidatus Dadabacteria bacterium CSP1-2]|nr:MAG: glycosyl transferase group 1 [Candidatus Dadabacteria bacterium CSP1-2]